MSNKYDQNVPRFKIPLLKPRTISGSDEKNTIKHEQNKAPAPTNLVELANQHLSTIGMNNSSMNLFLPQLKTGLCPPGLGNSLETKFFIPKLSLKTKNELESIQKELEIITHKEKLFSPTIDLSSVLIDPLVLAQKTSETMLSQSKFVTKCDIIKLMKTLKLEDVSCEIDSHHLLATHMSIKLKKRSTLANILTRQYHIRTRPYNVRHIFKVVEKENLPKRFAFTIPSPDDQILKHLKKDGKRN